MIPGLENAEFARLGGIHRNTYLNSPRLLDSRLRLKAAPRLRFAGQITGCEGYVESAAVGLIAGRFAAAERLGVAIDDPRRRPPRSARSSTTSPAAISNSIDAGPRSFQPMNVNFGLFPPIVEPRVDEAGKRLRGPERGVARKRALSARAEKDLATWIGETANLLAPRMAEAHRSPAERRRAVSLAPNLSELASRPTPCAQAENLAIRRGRRDARLRARRDARAPPGAAPCPLGRSLRPR